MDEVISSLGLELGLGFGATFGVEVGYSLDNLLSNMFWVHMSLLCSNVSNVYAIVLKRKCDVYNEIYEHFHVLCSCVLIVITLILLPFIIILLYHFFCN